MNPTLNGVVGALDTKKYTVFTDPYMLNIVGIRSKDTVINLFNDLMCVFYNDVQNGKNVFLQFPATTKPGTPWLLRPMTNAGTAVLVEKQYINCWKIDIHNNEYEALCQRLGEVQVYRDKDLDTNVDEDIKTIQSGYFGINIHRAGRFSLTQLVAKNSAGCQVIQNYANFVQLMNLAHKQEALYGNKFSYTLIHETDLV